MHALPAALPIPRLTYHGCSRPPCLQCKGVWRVVAVVAGVPAPTPALGHLALPLLSLVAAELGARGLRQRTKASPN